MRKQHVIYGLLDPETHQLRYVGYTSYPPHRLSQHHCPSELKQHTYKNNWIKSLLTRGLRAEMIIIEEFATEEELPAAEIKYIANYRNIGYNLVNGTDGGEGSQNPSEETRWKMGAGNRGKIGPNKGRKFSEESKRKMSESHMVSPGTMLDKHHSEESKKKMSKIHKGKPSWNKGKSGFISKIRKLTNEQVR